MCNQVKVISASLLFRCQYLFFSFFSEGQNYLPFLVHIFIVESLVIIYPSYFIESELFLSKKIRIMTTFLSSLSKNTVAYLNVIRIEPFFYEFYLSKSRNILINT